MALLFDVAVLIISLGVILLGAGVFTNAVEWVGKKLNLNKGAVGSILAAVGTALPETVIPIIAILLGTGDAGHAIGVGAILGAPFMLATLAIFVSGAAVISFRQRRGENFPRVQPDISYIKRDLQFFLLVYTLAVAATFLPHIGKLLVAFMLFGAYALYVYLTVREEQDVMEGEEELSRLYLARKNPDPSLALALLQVLLALLAIILGAKYFVDSLTVISGALGISPFIFALLIAPVATELPEKFNSVIWLWQKKDTYALGNISGAMVFQSSMIPAIGILLTPWELTGAGFLSAFFALASAAVTYWQVIKKGYLDARYMVLYGGGFYALFLILVLSGTIS